MQDFREILTELIREEELSLRQLASKSGLQTTQYSRYLHGKIPTIKVVIKMAEYFNCSLDYLFGLTTQRNNSKYKSYDYDMSEFVTRYRKLLKMNNISHYAFSKDASFEESILRHWRAGKIPRMDTLYEIASKLDGSLDALIGRK